MEKAPYLFLQEVAGFLGTSLERAIWPKDAEQAGTEELLLWETVRGIRWIVERRFGEATAMEFSRMVERIAEPSRAEV